MSATLLCGDSLTVLRSLTDGIARCCVTSPPYWGLRDYGVTGQLGLEPTPDAYVAAMVAVFREVRRVLTDDGTLWLNLGDSYAANWSSRRDEGGGGFNDNGRERTKYPPPGLKSKDLVGIPWRVAFALQADGWYLRSDIIWSKPNPMPESVTDRPTKAHEYVFLLSKQSRYYYDIDALREPHAEVSLARAGRNRFGGKYQGSDPSEHGALKSGNGYGPDGDPDLVCSPGGRNARSVWSIATQPYPEAHFATFPEELARRCIMAGSAPSDTVLDPFGGSGTVAQVATGNGRAAIHIDLNPAYIELARQRIGPMLCVGAA